MDAKTFARIVSYAAKMNPRGAPNFSDPEVLDFWYREFQEMGAEALSSILKRQLQEAKFFPTVAEIRKAAGGSGLSDDGQAREAASLIVRGVRTYGSIRHTERVKEFLGELAWAVVERRGGWELVCESMYSNAVVPTVEAQLRELAKSEIERARTGLTHTKPALPPKDRETLAPMTESDLLKSLPR